MYLLSGLTLNHSLNAGTLHCSNYLGSLLLKVKAEKRVNEVRVMVLAFNLSIFSDSAPGVNNCDLYLSILSFSVFTSKHLQQGKCMHRRHLQTVAITVVCHGGREHGEVFCPPK